MKKDTEWLANRVKRGFRATEIFVIAIVFVIGYFILQVIGLSSGVSIVVLALFGGLILMAKK